MKTLMNAKEEFKNAVIECYIKGTMTVKHIAERLNYSFQKSRNYTVSA